MTIIIFYVLWKNYPTRDREFGVRWLLLVPFRFLCNEPAWFVGNFVPIPKSWHFYITITSQSLVLTECLGTDPIYSQKRRHLSMDNPPDVSDRLEHLSQKIGSVSKTKFPILTPIFVISTNEQKCNCLTYAHQNGAEYPPKLTSLETNWVNSHKTNVGSPRAPLLGWE